VLSSVYARLGAGQRLILEYKLFEPAFYHTDVPDWGTAYLHCAGLGERALVCVDTGHHAPGTNIEFIVSVLLRAGKLGAFDFNSRFYADDDLMVGAADSVGDERPGGGGQGGAGRRRGAGQGAGRG
jgi:L-rhamnose isomerase / sugar isomerase